MSTKATKGFTIRINADSLNKLHVVADYEGRSLNSHFSILARESVKQFEKEHGEIKIKEKL